MKKLFYAIAILSVAVLAVNSCKKGTPEEPTIKKRLVMCGDEWDKYHFFYNADGSVKEVKRNLDETTGAWERTWTFTWNGKNATVKYVKEGEEQNPLSITLGGNGYIETFTDTWGDVRKCTYDLEGHLLKVFKVENDSISVPATPFDRELAAKGKDFVSIQGDKAVYKNQWTAGGNLIKWSRFTETGEQFKIQSFLLEKNDAGIFPDATDKAGIDRWMFEVGFFGKPSKLLMDQAAWEGAEDNATHTYTKDADNFVTKVEKFYGGELDQTYEYKWELLK